MELSEVGGSYRLYIEEKQGVALGILVLLKTGAPGVVAYLSKQLDGTAKDGQAVGA